MTWCFRSIPIQGRELTAYGLFSSHPDRFSALLETAQGEGRDFLVSREGHWDTLETSIDLVASDDFFSRWKQGIAEHESDSPAIRCLIYAAYEAGSLSEHLPQPKTDPDGPLLALFYPRTSLCFDSVTGTIHMAGESEDALDGLQSLVETNPCSQQAPASSADLAALNVSSGMDYRQAVERVKGYIAAGDIFQANIARFWSMPINHDQLLPLYANLRRVNPAPFACFARINCVSGPLTIVSASPERLFRVDTNRKIDTRPIAGTRKRGDGTEDDSLKTELLLSEKERAEHIMLVDLERNDLGRVCEPGSVRVDECMTVEQYSTVQHIVSNVSGRLAAGVDFVNAFRAMFPGGTITGCPKIRCMEIIHEMEAGARGPYTGGIGYIAWDGSADINILIRTFWHMGGRLHWAAGAGIVADSDPAMELAETGHKAEGLLRAFGGMPSVEGEG